MLGKEWLLAGISLDEIVWMLQSYADRIEATRNMKQPGT